MYNIASVIFRRTRMDFPLKNSSTSKYKLIRGVYGLSLRPCRIRSQFVISGENKDRKRNISRESRVGTLFLEVD